MQVLLLHCRPTQSGNFPLNYRPEPAATVFYDLSDDNSVRSSLCYVGWRKPGTLGLVRGLLTQSLATFASPVLGTVHSPSFTVSRVSRARTAQPAPGDQEGGEGDCVGHPESRTAWDKIGGK